LFVISVGKELLNEIFQHIYPVDHQLYG
jgi:hypothetical protein